MRSINDAVRLSLFCIVALFLSNVAAAGSLPTGWSDGDIGSVGVAGTGGYSNGVFTVTGAGDGLFTGSDGLNFAYQPVSGDCTIVARLLTSTTSSDPQVGVMIRETLDPSSRYASVIYNDRGQPSLFYFFDRATSGTNSNFQSSSGSYFLAYWIKLVRSGSNFSGYVSLDGVNWAQVGTTQLVPMGQSAFIGLSVDSRSTGVAATATFDNVSITSTSAAAPAITSVSATTGNIGSQVTIRGTGFGSPQGNSIAYLNGTALTVSAWTATSIQVTLPSGVTTGPLGVAVAPSMNSTNSIPFEVTTKPLPAGWLNQDVGLTAVAGNATYSNNAFTIVAAGNGIDNGSDTTSDNFHFVYQPLPADGTLIARVASLTGGGSGQRVGLMIRQDLTSGATGDFLYSYNNNGEVIDSYRPSLGSSRTFLLQNLAGVTLPFWLKVVRQSSFVNVYTSTDGVNWSPLSNGPPPFALQGNLLIGLGATSCNSIAVTTVFDNVSMSTATLTSSITSLSTTTGPVGTAVIISGSGFGSTQGASQVYLNDSPVTITSWSNTSIGVTIPSGVTSGPLVASVAPAMDDTNAAFFTVTSQPLLSGWLDADVGAVGVVGSATYNAGTFTVNGSGGAGGGVTGVADAFHFVYQPVSTNATIIARVTNSGGNFAQTGVMIRETLTGASPVLFPNFVLRPPNSFDFSCLVSRPGANAVATTTTGSASPTLPYWLKAVRSGNVFTAYTSPDGSVWTPMGSPQTITTAQTVYMGFAATSGNGVHLAAATFDNVSLSLGAALPNPVVASVTPTSGVPGSAVQIQGSGFGSSQGTSTVTFGTGSVATVTSWSDGQIFATVPDGAATGTVSVVVSNITGTGPIFTVSFKAQLTDSLQNVSTYTSQVAGSRWELTNLLGSGCSTCSTRGNLQLGYDGLGNPMFVTDALGNMTQNSYDASNNLLSSTVPQSAGVNATTSYTYNTFGEVLTATDPLGLVTTNTYDGNGNLLSTRTPSPDGSTSGSLTQFTYDSKGELLTIIDPLNNVTTLTYFPTGLIQTITDAQNHVTTYGYDSFGNRTSVIDANNKQTTFAYDSGNRLKTITYPDSTTTQFGYDYRGRRTSVTDQNNKTTTYAYDDADRLTSVTDAANNVTTYGYDTESNLTSIKDANNNTTSFAYDAFGRVTKTTFPSTLFESYSYDANGNLLSKTDRNAHTITYTYDLANRLTNKAYPDATQVKYTLDKDSRLTQVVDPSGTYTFTFDNMGRLLTTSTQYSFLARTLATSYSYDKASNRTGFTDPESGSTTYAYDTLNRLQTLTPPAAFGTGNFGFSYDALSRRTQMTRPNNVTTNYAYDNLSRLTSVLHQLSGSTIDGATYTLDNAGNRTAKTDQRTAVATSYGYDNIYQLLSATQGVTTTESYAYDAVGNRTASLGVSSYTTNSSNELTAMTGATFTYDNNGNELTKVDSTGTTSYTWDYENRLTSVTLPGTGGTVQFSYDPFGRRIKKASSAGTSIFAYDGDNQIEETNASGTVVARYSQGLSIDEPLAMLRSSVTSFYNADGLGNVTSLANASGALAQTYMFDSFGRQTASSGSLTNPFQYTGRESDPETGLYYYRARYYDSNAGRFVSEDPASFLSGGLNLFRYVENSPLGFTDPNGLQAKPSAPCCDDKKLKDGLRKAQQALSSAAATKSNIFKKYQPCLLRLSGDLELKCAPPPKDTPRACGYHNDFSPSSIFITPNGSRGLGGCDGVKSTVVHEMVHSCYQNDLNGPRLSDLDQEREAFRLECQLFGTGCACARNPKLCGY